MTVTCARCHDHKFDPIPTRDYYSFYGMIANSDRARRVSAAGQRGREFPAGARYREGMQRRLAALDEFKTKRHAQLVAEFRQASWISRYLMAAQKGAKMNNAELEKLSTDSDFNLFVLRRWRDYLNATRKNHDPVFAAWNALAAVPAENCVATAAFRPPRRQSADHDALCRETARLTGGLSKIYGEVLSRADSAEKNTDADAEQVRLALRGAGCSS